MISDAQTIVHGTVGTPVSDWFGFKRLFFSIGPMLFCSARIPGPCNCCQHVHIVEAPQKLCFCVCSCESHVCMYHEPADGKNPQTRARCFFT